MVLHCLGYIIRDTSFLAFNQCIALQECDRLGRELLLQQVLEGLAVLSELLDTLVELLEGH